MKLFNALAIILVLPFSLRESRAAATIPLSTAERSGGTETGRAEESDRLCAAFAHAYPKKVRCEKMGTTPEGRDLRVLVVSVTGKTTPALAKKAGLPVVWIQAGIHAGEIEGKDAGYAYLKRELALPTANSALREVVVLFCPILNVDGHERFGKGNRPNQNGPIEMGWRVNAQNLNLNRDYLKLDSPEVAATLNYLNAWDPVAWIDLHTTDGAQFQHDIAVVMPSVQNGVGDFRTISRSIENEVQGELRRRQHLPLAFYPEFVRPDEPTSGFEHFPGLPRMGYEYWAYRNRLGVLVETHSWKPYAARMAATDHVVSALVATIGKQRSELVKAIGEADRISSRVAGASLPLRWKAAPVAREIEFLGYHYEIRPSEVSGKNWIHYDETKPEVWKVPLREVPVVDSETTAPSEGYWVDAGIVPLVRAKLDAHGIHYEVLNAATTGEYEVFRASSVTHTNTSYEGHVRAEWKGAWKKETVLLPKNSLFVPSTQPRIRIAAFLFEPEFPDSLAAWGTLDAFTEPKEYVEDYLLEPFAREKLKVPAVRAEFDAKMKDEKFRASPTERLAFFYALHPAADSHYRRLPIFRR